VFVPPAVRSRATLACDVAFEERNPTTKPIQSRAALFLKPLTSTYWAPC